MACAARSVERIADCTVKASIDVNDPDSPMQLRKLIEQLGGMDLYIHVAGIGYDNPALNPAREAEIAMTNSVGFARMVSTAFEWFANNGKSGQIAAVSSVAGTKGIGGMEAYCASKRFDWTYLQGLRQRAATAKLPIVITDIRPGWVRTPLIHSERKYPMLMEPQRACRLIERAIARKRKRAVIDCRWAVLQFFWQLIPDCIWRHIRYYV